MEVKFPNVNNKLAFFDFDRTLVAHKYSDEYIRAIDDDYFMDCVYSLTALKDEHVNDKPLPCMQWYAKRLFDNGYGLYCLTHEVFNLRDALKQEQLKLFYPDTPMTYLTVDCPEHKIDMMKAVAMAECCDLSDIIFVDDRMDTISLAMAAGIDAKHLSDIVVLYENSLAFKQQDTVIKATGLPGCVTESDDVQISGSLSDEMLAQNCGLSNEDLEKTFRECRQMIARSHDTENNSAPL